MVLGYKFMRQLNFNEIKMCVSYRNLYHMKTNASLIVMYGIVLFLQETMRQNKIQDQQYSKKKIFVAKLSLER